MQNFNSHTREGVTYGLKRCQVHHENFNSHTREGVTMANVITFGKAYKFQLTHP